MNSLKRILIALMVGLLPLDASAGAPPVDAGFSGIWFDPDQSGHGFALEILDGAAVVYWFLYDRDGAQRWLVGIGNVDGERVIVAEMLEVRGGAFHGFDAAAVDRIPVGQIEFTFSSCDDGHAAFRLGDADGEQNLARLGVVAGTACGEPGNSEAGGRSGSWFGPAFAGTGFVVGMMPDQQAYVFWFTFDPAGAPLWLIGNGRVHGKSVIFDELLRATSSGFVDSLDPSSVQLEPWGRLTLHLSCDQGMARWAGPSDFGRGGYRIERLTRLSGTACQDELLVSSRFSDNVLRFDATTGAFLDVFASGSGLDNPNGIAIGLDGDLLAVNGDDGRVLRFDGVTGDFLDVFIEDDPSTLVDETGGLRGGRGMLLSRSGELLVSSGRNRQVLAFDAETGVFLRRAAFGVDGPIGLAQADDGTLYVAGGLSDAIHVFDPETGVATETPWRVPSITNFTGLALSGDDRLFAASGASSQVLEFDRVSGQVVRVVAAPPQIDIAIGLSMNHFGDLYVASFGSNAVVQVSPTDGMVTTIVPSGAGGLNGTHFIEIVPRVAAEN